MQKRWSAKSSCRCEKVFGAPPRNLLQHRHSPPSTSAFKPKFSLSLNEAFLLFNFQWVWMVLLLHILAYSWIDCGFASLDVIFGGWSEPSAFYPSAKPRGAQCRQGEIIKQLPCLATHAAPNRCGPWLRRQLGRVWKYGKIFLYAPKIFRYTQKRMINQWI